ncbi:monovalent cation/H(+) antiporter subunit G [Agrococcus lahaulensis]|uniref:monovalent cation/H(+) antiporter subunit G n=1 Tax=Agrococcus lahaulensis TaxID=341722 RepID=UPI000554A776|nr:monovalent cation/H(+) antiporter subunit G [Agrococcus lahaulensis]
MSLESVLDVIGSVLILIGASFTLTAAIGLVRLPDVLNRMHAGSKPQTLGFLMLCVGLSLVLRDGSATAMLAVAACLQLVTSPVATQVMAKAAYRTGQYRADLVVEDREREVEDRDDRDGDAGNR